MSCAAPTCCSLLQSCQRGTLCPQRTNFSVHPGLRVVRTPNSNSDLHHPPLLSPPPMRRPPPPTAQSCGKDTEACAVGVVLGRPQGAITATEAAPRLRLNFCSSYVDSLPYSFHPRLRLPSRRQTTRAKIRVARTLCALGHWQAMMHR